MWQGWETRGTKVMDYMKSTWKPTHAFISGKVTKSRGEPVAGVQIALSASDKKATTDAKGVYWLFAVKPGDWDLKATKTGYSTASTKLSLKPGDIHKANFALKPDKP
jgi:protocatechuate 3,4-dioxygenase beta subunit